MILVYIFMWGNYINWYKLVSVLYVLAMRLLQFLVMKTSIGKNKSDIILLQ